VTRRLWPAIAALAAVAALGAAGSPALAVTPRASLPDIEQQVMCPVCGVPLSIASSPQAERERVFIRGLIDRGEDTAQIKRELVAQFGPSVLALPSARGFNLAAYLVPLGVVALLVLGVAFTLPRWHRRGRSPAFLPGGPAPSPTVAEDSRLDEDLARFDA
jgi:cytochrome c-type biogenesis protein CcmH